MPRLRVCLVNAVNPPGGGSRGERWAHLVSELCAAGCDVTIVRELLPEPFFPRDEGLEDIQKRAGARFIDMECGLVPRLAFPPRRESLVSRMKRFAAHLAWPDPWVGFSRRAARWVCGEAAAFDVIITSGMPWSDHVAGYEIARRTGLPWVADYGDPWTLAQNGDGWNRTAGFRLERLLLQRCALVVVTTQETRELFAREFGVAQERILVLPGGVAGARWPSPPDHPMIRFAHAGLTYDPRASVEPFLRAFAAARASLPLWLDWFGDVARMPEQEWVRRTADRYTRQAPLRDVIDIERQTHVIVVFGNHGGTQLPAKVWRALASGRLVMAIAADAHDPLLSVPELRSHGVVVENNEAAIGAALQGIASRLPDWTWEPPTLPTWSDRAGQLLDAITGIQPAPRSGPAAGVLTAAANLALIKAPEAVRKVMNYGGSSRKN